MTSFDVCYRLRKVFNTRAIGHTGTLDPLASGVMIVLIDKATKTSQFIIVEDKEYIASVEYGYLTDTLDVDGKIIERRAFSAPTKEDIVKVLNKYTMTYDQLPPMTSAIKVNGKKLYEYQRKGIEVEIPKREVTIYENELLDLNDHGFCFRSKVSSGTYIRALVRDMMKDLGVLGTLKELKRTKVGTVSIDQCYTLDEIYKGKYELHSTYELLSKMYKSYELINVDDVKNGKKLSIKSDQDRILITSNKEAIAIYDREYEDTYRCVRGLF